jgi:hypothetical protein
MALEVRIHRRVAPSFATSSCLCVCSARRVLGVTEQYRLPPAYQTLVLFTNSERLCKLTIGLP